MTEEYKERLRKIRDLKLKGSSYEVLAMQEIVELEKTSVLWRKDKSTTFDEVLRREKGLCTPSRYKAFKKATVCFPASTIEKLGVPCVCLLAMQPTAVRNNILGYAMKFRTTNGSEPTYQYVCKFLRKKRTGPTRGQLLKYNEQLLSFIRSKGFRPPAMTLKPD